MARIHRILTALTIASAIVSLPAAAQSSASLTHVVSVTVPSRVKVQVASISASSPAAVRMSTTAANTNGLAVTVRASKAWVLVVTSASGVASKSQLQWALDGNSGVATLSSKNTERGEPVFLTVTAP